MSATRQARAIVKRLAPVEGFWKPDSEERLIEAASDLLDAEVPPSLVETTLATVLAVGRSEYGE